MIDLPEVLRLHQLWLRGEKGGKRADLRGANLRYTDLAGIDLRGANLRYSDMAGADLAGADLHDTKLPDIGNAKEIKSFPLEVWGFAYTATVLRIGCQQHPIKKWRKWNTKAGRKWINMMDDSALEWADKWLDWILALIDKSPATPTTETKS